VKCLLIFNPIAGKGIVGRAVSRLSAELGRRGFEVELYQTRHPGDAREKASRDGRGYELVLCAGGDGTVNEVLNGLARTETPLMVCPLGTGNVAAKELRIRFSFGPLLRTIAAGHALRVDLGTANGRFFFNMAGVGFDALVTHLYHSRFRRGNMRMIEYVPVALRTFSEYRYPTIRVRTPAFAGEAGFVVVANSSSYGGPFCFCPSASLLDGELDVNLMPGRRPRDFIRYTVAAFLNMMPAMHDVKFVRAREVVVDASEPTPYQVDGDAAGWTPVRIEVVPRAVTVLVPPGTPGAGRLW